MASARRCFLAAGEMAVEGVALLFELESREQLIRVGAAMVELREELDGLFHPQLVGQGSRLEDGADRLLELFAALFGIEAADAHDAAIGRAQTLEDFDG